MASSLSSPWPLPSSSSKTTTAEKKEIGLDDDHDDNATISMVKLTFQTKRQSHDDEDIDVLLLELVLECHRTWAPASFDRIHEMIAGGFMKEQYLVRAIPNFVLDWNYGPTSTKKKQGKDDDDDDVHDDDTNHQYTWFVPNQLEPTLNGTQQCNTIGTVSFGQEEDGRTKTELFINMTDTNSPKLDALGFWPFAKVVETRISTTTTTMTTMTTNEKTMTRAIPTTLDTGWVRVVESFINMQYGDIFFGSTKDRHADKDAYKKATIRQKLLVEGGNEYIARTYPGMTQLVDVEVIVQNLSKEEKV